MPDKTPYHVGDLVRLTPEARNNADYDWSHKLMDPSGFFILGIEYPREPRSNWDIQERGTYRVISDNRDRTRVWVHHIERVYNDA